MLFQTCCDGGQVQQEFKERSYERITCIIEETYAIGMRNSRFLSWKDTFYVNREKIPDQNTSSNSPRTSDIKKKIRERIFPSQEIHPKVRISWVQSLRVKIRWKIVEEISHEERCVRKEAWQLTKKFTSSRIRVKQRFFPIEVWDVVVYCKISRRATIRCRFKSINARVIQKTFMLRWTRHFVKDQESHCKTYTTRGKCKYTFTILFSSQQCNSMKRLLLWRLGNFAKTTNILMSGSADTNHGCSKIKKWHVKRRTSHLPMIPNYPSILATLRRFHRHYRIVLQSSSRDLTPGDWRGPPQKRDDNRDSDDNFRDLPEYLKEFADDLEDTEMHTPALISQERPAKVTPRKQGNIVFIQNNKDSFGDALEIQFLEQKSLMTWWRLITRSSTRKKNHGIISDTLSLFKILLLNGFNRIRAKDRLPRRRQRIYEKFLDLSLQIKSCS